jgi:glycosidase
LGSERVREVRVDVMLVAEAIHGDYVRMSRHLTTVTQYELWKAIWSSLNDGKFFELADALKRHAGYCQHFQPWTFVGNHDTTRIATQLKDKRHLPHALTVLFTTPRIPDALVGGTRRRRPAAARLDYLGQRLMSLRAGANHRGTAHQGIFKKITQNRRRA